MNISSKIVSVSALLVCIIIYPVFGRGDYREALNYYLDGRFGDALTRLEKAYSEEPDRREVINLYSEVLVIEAGRYYEKEEYGKAFELIEKAKEIKPEDENIAGIHGMLYSILHPEDEVGELPDTEETGEVFSGLHREHRERQEERVKIIREPPETITVRELELLRPILISEKQEPGYGIYYVAGAAGFVLIVFMVMTGLWVKKISETSRYSLEAVTQGADEKIRRMEEEMRRRRKEELAREMEKKAEEHSRKNSELLREKKIKKEYSRILTQTLSSREKTPPRFVPEPEISSSRKEEEQRAEIYRSFRSLEKSNYSGAAGLVSRMASDPNPWVRLWAGELAGYLKSGDALNVLKALSGDKEYQVKKAAIKTLGLLAEKDSSSEVKRAAADIKKQARSEGWVT